jgi:RNA polymerase sigma factor (TIGR02999 family)
MVQQLDPARVEQLVRGWKEKQDLQARNELIEYLYQWMKGMAHAMLQKVQLRHKSLTTTELAHDMFLKLEDAKVVWRGDAQFFKFISLAMRRYLLDLAKSGSEQRVTFNQTPDLELKAGGANDNQDVLLAYDIIDQLAELNERQARVLELHIIFGFTAAEIFREIGVEFAVAEATIYTDLKKALVFFRMQWNQRATA